MTALAEYREPRVGPATGPMLRNTSARFGTQSYCDCGTAPGLSMGGIAPYTLEAWIKPRSVTGGFIVGKLSEGSLSIVKGHLLAGRNVGDRGVGSVAIRSTTVLETGRWYHVATTFDGMSLTLYANGRPEVSASSGADRRGSYLERQPHSRPDARVNGQCGAGRIGTGRPLLLLEQPGGTSRQPFVIHCCGRGPR